MADLSAHRRRPLVLALVAVLALVLVGCGDDDDGAADDPPATTSGAVDGADGEAFCTEMDRIDVERPEAYVGSEEHLADVEALVEVAPDEIRPAVERYRDFVASGQITDDPDSKQLDGWPEDVQADVAAIQDHRTAVC